MAVFSLQELDMAAEPTWMLMKQNIMHKVKLQMEETADKLKTHLNQKHSLFPEELDFNNAKISRGENYKGLPYHVLDFPAYYHKDDIFAFRIIFIWGYPISFCFQIHGSFLQTFHKQIVRNISQLASKQFYFCINENPWEHFNKEDNYCMLNQLKNDQVTQQISIHKFVKLSSFCPISEIEEMPFLAINFSDSIMKILGLKKQ